MKRATTLLASASFVLWACGSDDGGVAVGLCGLWLGAPAIVG
jgi:hypothetical protein